MFQAISIPYIINNTSKEIYEFKQTTINRWEYVGIYYSNRNDENDVWGDEWNKFYAEKMEEEIQAVVLANGFEDFSDMMENTCSCSFSDREISLIRRKYSPSIQKTQDGRLYYSGIYWGLGRSKGKPAPKMSEKKISEEILRRLSWVEVRL